VVFCEAQQSQPAHQNIARDLEIRADSFYIVPIGTLPEERRPGRGAQRKSQAGEGKGRVMGSSSSSILQARG